MTIYEIQRLNRANWFFIIVGLGLAIVAVTFWRSGITSTRGRRIDGHRAKAIAVLVIAISLFLIWFGLSQPLQTGIK